MIHIWPLKRLELGHSQVSCHRITRRKVQVLDRTMSIRENLRVNAINKSIIANWTLVQGQSEVVGTGLCIETHAWKGILEMTGGLRFDRQVLTLAGDA